MNAVLFVVKYNLKINELGMIALNKKVYLTNKEINVIVDALDEYVFEHSYDEYPIDADGKYYDEEYPYEADTANAIQEIYSKLL